MGKLVGNLVVLVLSGAFVAQAGAQDSFVDNAGQASYEFDDTRGAGSYEYRSTEDGKTVIAIYPAMELAIATGDLIYADLYTAYGFDGGIRVRIYARSGVREYGQVAALDLCPGRADALETVSLAYLCTPYYAERGWLKAEYREVPLVGKRLVLVFQRENFFEFDHDLMIQPLTSGT